MGKGYNNFMSKKTFHPGSNANQERVREAEARTQAKRKHDEETLAQYLKEQELFNQKSLISKESKEKLSLSFMYDLPPGVAKKDSEKNPDKVEWTGTSASSKPIVSSSLPKSSASSEDDGPGLCLEWKRDKPVKNSNQHRKIIKTEPAVKQEKADTRTNDTTIKEERDKKVFDHPSSKVESMAATMSRDNDSCRSRDRETKPDLKRIKRERQT